MYGHPAATRASLVQTAHDMAVGSPSANLARQTPTSRPRASSNFSADPNFTEGTPLLDERLETGHYHTGSKVSTPAAQNGHGHGHSHAGSMNMQALVLHVLGDALGNVGVIATGLVIWLTNWQYKYYFDPTISLVITVIIFSSALPLGELIRP